MPEEGTPLALQMQLSQKPYSEERSLLMERFSELEDKVDWLEGMMTRAAPLVQSVSQSKKLPLEIRVLGDNIPGGQIRNSHVDFHQHLFSGTFTDDSPSAGYVAWADVTITFKGTAYEVVDGNTDKTYIYWELSTPTTFQTANTFPGIGADDIVVALNDSGTHRLIMMWGGIVSTELLNDLAVNNAKLALLSVDAPNLMANSVISEKIYAGAVTANKISVAQLSAIVADMGLLTAGEVRLGTGTPGSNFTGLRLYKSGSTYRLEGRNNEVLEAYFDSDGTLKAGGGDVVLDDKGISLAEGAGTSNKMRWLAGATLVAWIGAEDFGAIEEMTFGLANNPEILIRSGASGCIRLQEIGALPLQFNDANTQIYEDSGSRLTFTVGGTDYVKMGPTGQLRLVNRATQDIYLIDGGTVDATEQAWVEAKIGGVTGYVHIYAAK